MNYLPFGRGCEQSGDLCMVCHKRPIPRQGKGSHNLKTCLAPECRAEYRRRAERTAAWRAGRTHAHKKPLLMSSFEQLREEAIAFQKELRRKIAAEKRFWHGALFAADHDETYMHRKREDVA